MFSPKCPFCKKKIKDLIFNFETGKGKCAACGADYNLRQTFSLNDAIYLAKILQGEAKEKIMQLYALEEKPKVVKTSKLFIMLFWGVFLSMVVVMAILLHKRFSDFIGSVLGVIFFSLFLIWIYKQESTGTIIRKIRREK